MKEKFYEKIKKIIYTDSFPTALFYIILAITIILMIISFEYIDLDSLTAWSVNLWDLLIKGRLGEFYSYCEDNYLRGACHENCHGGYLMLIPLAIWNFPLWVTHYFSGITLVTTPLCLIWAKTGYLVYAIITAVYCCKIASLLGIDKKYNKYIVLLILGSSEILISIFYAGQDEIVYIMFFILAIYYYINGNKFKFVLWSTFSVTCCPIMLIPYVALILIRYKNIFKILGLLIISILPNALFDIVYRNDTIYQTVKVDINEMVTGILNTNVINTSLGSVSIMGIFLVLVYFYCYFIYDQDNKINQKQEFYIITILMTLLTLFADNDFYRLFLYVPFFAIIVFLNSDNIHFNLLIVTVLNYLRAFLSLTVNEGQNMNTQYMMKNNFMLMLCKRFDSNRYIEYLSINSKLYDNFDVYNVFIVIIGAVATACIGIFLYYNLKNKPIRLGKYPISIMFFIYILCMPIILLGYYVLLFDLV